MEKINKLFSLLEGKVLCFGIQREEELKFIEENDKIQECFLLNSIDLETGQQKKNKKRKRTTTPKQMLKKWGKKGIDILVINEEEFKNYEKKLLPLFIQLTRFTIYLYHVPDFEKIQKRYKRYHTTTMQKKEYIEVDVKNAKQNIVKNMWYFLIDSCMDFFDMMSDILGS